MSQAARQLEATKREFVESLAGENRRFYSTGDGKGVLRMLDLTFDDRWMYVFELIQNALDANADRMSFRIEQDDALCFQHNGTAPISEDSVEGLSKVFRSTKGAATIGFMGIGFKSVFRRYRNVFVSGWGWRFRFSVPEKTGERYGDVRRDMLGAVMPIWHDSLDEPTAGFTTRFRMQGLVRTDDDGGIGSDLSHLTRGTDKPLLAILARAGLKWLDLDGAQWEFGTHPDHGHTLEATALSDNEDRLWQVFSVDCTPSNQAVARFLEHRKIQPEPEEEDGVYRDASRPRPVIGVVPLDNNGIPTPPTRGRVHALLPTTVTIELGLHLSADWLLNISRTGLKEIEDNEWQRDHVAATADLFAQFVRWVARLESPSAIKAGFSALRVPTPDGGLADMLADESWLRRLRDQVCDEPVFPAWENDGSLSFRRASEILVPPASLATAFGEEPGLNPAMLMGGPVLAESVLGQGARSLLGGGGILREMAGEDLLDVWNGKGLESWWSRLDGDDNRKRDLLFRLWAAVAECGERSADLPCVRTISGAWVGANSVHYFGEALPSDQIPEGLQVRSFLLAHRPDSEHLLPGQWVPALRQGSSEVASRAWEWLSGSAKALTLKQVVDDAIVGLAGSQTTDWSILVPLAQWARRLRRSDLLTHVLVDDGNRQVGRPTKEALLADPYVVDGAIRRRLSRTVDVVSGAYQDASDGQAHEWARFFEESGVTGAVTVWRVPVKSPSKTDAERFAAVDVDYSTQGYTLVDYDLHWSSRQSVLPGLSMPENAPALSAWLASGAVALRGFGRRRVEWFYYREQTKQGSALSTWAATLTELAWVPCQDGQYRRPAAVLPREGRCPRRRASCRLGCPASRGACKRRGRVRDGHPRSPIAAQAAEGREPTRAGRPRPTAWGSARSRTRGR